MSVPHQHSQAQDCCLHLILYKMIERLSSDFFFCNAHERYIKLSRFRGGLILSYDKYFPVRSSEHQPQVVLKTKSKLLGFRFFQILIFLYLSDEMPFSCLGECVPAEDSWEHQYGLCLRPVHHACRNRSQPGQKVDLMFSVADPENLSTGSCFNLFN